MSTSSETKAPKHFQYRTVFLSDIHLGTRDCKAEELLTFLNNLACDTIYLVGDIIDLWAMRRKWFWAPAHNEVIRKLTKTREHGPKVIFVPGNHDELFRDYDGFTFGNVEIRNEDIHITADGKKLLICHGDEFDAVVTNAKLITMVGDWLYYVLLYINRKFNRLRRIFGRPYWSLSGFIKSRVKSVVQFISHFEGYLVKEARHRKVDGVVCGHIHHAEIRDVEGIQYINCGDWVESCTAIVEHMDGRLEILDLKRVDLMVQKNRKPSSDSMVLKPVVLADDLAPVSSPELEPVNAKGDSGVSEEISIEENEEVAV